MLGVGEKKTIKSDDTKFFLNKKDRRSSFEMSQTSNVLRGANIQLKIRTSVFSEAFIDLNHAPEHFDEEAQMMCLYNQIIHFQRIRIMNCKIVRHILQSP